MAVNGPCPLFALAHELLDNIFLQIDSVRALANFIPSTRFIYQHFRSRRRRLLAQILRNELGPVWPDAIFLPEFCREVASTTGKIDEDFKFHYYEDLVYDNAARYRDHLSGRADIDPVPSLGELTDLCRTLHKNNLIVSLYIRTRLRSNLSPDNSDASSRPATAPASRTERLRVLRALYRRGIVGEAYHLRLRMMYEAQYWVLGDSTPQITNTSNLNGERLGIFAAFEPWELQQIEHIDHFINRLCAGLFSLAGHRCRDTYIMYKYLHARESCRDNRWILPCAALFSLAGHNYWEYSPAMESCRDKREILPICPGVLFNMLSAGDDLARCLREYPGLVDMALSYNLPTISPRDYGVQRDNSAGDVRISSAVRNLFPETKTELPRDTEHWQCGGLDPGDCMFYVGEASIPFFGRCEQEQQREDIPVDPAREQRERDGEKVEFKGDAAHLPPFGWLDATDGRYNSWYGEALGCISGFHAADDESLRAFEVNLELWRSAGFAMWDRSRVESMKRLARFGTLRTGWVPLR